MAWDVRGNGKTVVRAAGSLLNAMLITSELLNPVPFGANFPDLGINTSGTAANAHSPALFPLNGGQLTWTIAGPVFPGNAAFTDAKGVTYTGLTCTSPSTPNGPGPCPTTGVDPNFREPYVASWNLDIQRAITNNLTMDVAYVGNHGFKQGSEADINQPAIGAGWDAGAIAACLTKQWCRYIAIAQPIRPRKSVPTAANFRTSPKSSRLGIFTFPITMRSR